MRIACPNCGAAYDVAPERVPPGRTVKCARCANNWTPVPGTPMPETAASDPVPEPATRVSPNLPAPNVIERSGTTMTDAPIPGSVPPPAAPASEPSVDIAFDAPVPGPPPPSPRLPLLRSGRLPLAATWLASLLVLAGLGWAAVVHRAEIMHAWPPSERAYSALGLGTPPTDPASPSK